MGWKVEARSAGANGIKEQSERDLCSPCVGKSRVWSQVMPCSRCSLRTGVAFAVLVASMAPEARVHGLRSTEWESE